MLSYRFVVEVLVKIRRRSKNDTDEFVSFSDRSIRTEYDTFEPINVCTIGRFRVRRKFLNAPLIKDKL